MPRWPNSKKNKSNDPVIHQGPPGNHPQENHIEHRQFLIRSLERNDVDLAALTDLHRTLRESKANILNACGERVLLQLGKGQLKLVNDELHQESSSASDISLSPTQKEYCVDFLLRMKLRRQLCNRLARRLHRIATAMDGTDVAPPPPPKYGDLRLFMDPAQIQAFAELKAQQEQVKQRILNAPVKDRLKGDAGAIPGPTSGAIKAVSDDEQEVAPKPAAAAAEETPSTEPMATEAPPPTAATEVPKEAEPEAPASAPKAKEGDEPPKEEEKQETPSAEAPKAGTDEAPADDVAPKEGNKDATPPVAAETPKDTDMPEAAASEEPPKEEPSPPTASSSEVQPPPKDGETPAPPEEAPKVPEEPSAAPAEASSSSAVALTTAKEDKDVEMKPAEDSAMEVEAQKKEEEEKAPPASESKPPEPVASTTAPSAPTAAASTREKEEENPSDSTPLTQADWNLIREYHTMYEKKWDPETKSFVYRHQDEQKPDFSKIPYQGGVGAMQRNMSQEEREMDYKRWQTQLLARLPEQPTFADLGLQNRVFLYEERHRACLKQEREENNNSGSDDSDDDRPLAKKQKKDNDSSDSDMLDDDEGVTTKRREKVLESGDDSSDGSGDEVEETDEKKKKANEDKTDNKDKEEEQGHLEVHNRIRAMPLVAVPSFYEQDLKRIRMIQSAMLVESMSQQSRQKLSELTHDYNRAYNNSIELVRQKQSFQHEYGIFLQQTKSRIAQMDAEYHNELNVARSQWLKRKHEHDQHKIKSSFPSYWERTPDGTSTCQNFMRAGGLYQTLGTCMADIVDASILFGEGKLTPKPLEPFVAPPRPAERVVDQNTGETLAQQTTRVDSDYKKRIAALDGKIYVSEEDRKQAWKKLQKAKADEMALRGGRRMHDTYNAPCPPLQTNGQQPLPRDYAASRDFVPSYIPTPSSRPKSSTPGGVGLSTINMPKYTPGGVQQRTGRDGSVAPVSEPKKTPDGLYQRPAGRQRKGMQWDAVRGIWVPE